MSARERGAFGAAAGIGAFFALQGLDAGVPLAWAALTLGAGAAALTGALDLERRLDRCDVAFLAFLASCALSAACGVDPRRSFALSVPALGALLVWIVLRRAGAAERVQRATALGLGACAAVQAGALLVSAVQRPDAAPATWVPDAGAAWLLVPNDVGWIGCVLPWVAWAAWPARPLRMALLCVLPYLALCALLHSRSAALAGAVSCALFAASLRVGQGATRRRGVLIAAAVGAAALLATLSFAAASMQARAQLWHSAWSLFLAHPLTGYGLHDFVMGYRDTSAATWIDDRITPWPHNLLLEIAAECGVIGLGAAMWLAVCVVRRGLAATRTAAFYAAYSGLSGLLLLALVEASLLRQWVWLAGAALLAFAGAQPGIESNASDVVAEGPAPARVRRAARR